MLDPEDMCQNTEEFTGEFGTVVAQANQRNYVVAYPAINENLSACICHLIRYGNCNRDLLMAYNFVSSTFNPSRPAVNPKY
jgi:hypothetical protein